MEVATVQSIILSLSVTLLLLIGGRTRLLSSDNVSNGRELLLRSLVTIVVILSVVFNVVQCNAIQTSNDQRAVVFVSVVAAIIVDFFNRSGAGTNPCCATTAMMGKREQNACLKNRKSILEPNLGPMLMTTSLNTKRSSPPSEDGEPQKADGSLEQAEELE